MTVVLMSLAGGAYAAEFSELQSFKAGEVAAAAGTAAAEAPEAKAAIAGVQAQNGDFMLYNSQSEALTMSTVCRILEKRQADLGKTTSVRCVARQGGLMELVASDIKTNKTKSILFNMTDKTVIEYRGGDQVHNYRNNLGQHFFLNLSFVNNGQVLTQDGVLVKGWYRADFYLRDSAGENRFGYFSGVNY
ncbi:MAG: hypothetical protein A2X35_03960 [Elusimicrobia bacterium GWA2_61_42]|nr:MAG: hypothetical protein A2X35_03960 [Elusimicrobia bacterium GWA2_61_42]OGR76733.1 MAG: hypothetical protein A2X38_12825 [Elusimicrobia bacterium GWC2_61_25]